MSSPSSTRWFSTPDGRTLYALTVDGQWTEHQRMGKRYQLHRMDVKTYADRLHVAALIERLDAGLLEVLDEEEYRNRVRNIEQLERLGGEGE